MDPTPGRQPRTRPDWDDYVDAFHRDRPGITEDLLRGARLGELDPYEWLTAAVDSTAGTVLDVGCGSGPVAGGFTRWIGVDRATEELRVADARGRAPLVRAAADSLPVRTAASEVALCVMSLQILCPLDAALAELARVVRPGGQLVLLLPARRPVPLRDGFFYLRLQRRLSRTIGYPNDLRLGGTALATLVDSHCFAVESDERAGFTLRLRDRGDAERLVRSLYLPGVTAGRVGRAVALVERRVGRSVTIPLRRVVLRRQTTAATASG